MPILEPDIANSVRPSAYQDDVAGSCNGHGTIEIRDVIKIFESADIPACLTGVSALMYFGARRLRSYWEICVPTEMLDRASSLLKSQPHDKNYEMLPPMSPLPASLHHTYPLFKVRGVRVRFLLIPAEDAHFECKTSMFERSKMGLPYPKLEVFAQSLLATRDLVALPDLVDGMNLTEEWGGQYLQLNGKCDEAWGDRMHEKIVKSVSHREDRDFFAYCVVPQDLRETWREAVQGKSGRIGLELQDFPGVLTRYCFEGDVDPRLREGQQV